jgi:hypothetical protein
VTDDKGTTASTNASKTVLNRPNITVEAIAISKSIVGQGYTMNINVTVENQGDFTETFNITVYVNATEIETKQVTLANGASIILTFTWDTSGYVKGNYTLWAYAEPVQGETETMDNMLAVWIFLTLPGDINGDQKVNILDAILLANAFNSKPGDPNWSSNADINGDSKVNILDAIILASYFNQKWP